MCSTSEFNSFAARLRRLMQASNTVAAAGVHAFDQFALELFALQFQHNAPYRRFCEARGATPEAVDNWTEIPAVPPSAFKEWELSCLPVAEREVVFHSSGTTLQRPSRHFHNAESLTVYQESALAWFNANSRSPIANSQLVVLTPPPAAAPHSSLVHMFEAIRRQLGTEASAFVGEVAEDGGWRLRLEAAVALLRGANATAQPLLMLGTAFSFVHLLDHLADRDLRFDLPPGSRALETGGYKGRSRSLPREALHELITQRLGIPPVCILCEYGMSELNSQAYDLPVGPGDENRTRNVGSDVSFPLTPALSLGERECPRPRGDKAVSTHLFAGRTAIPPLPKGEGRGEGADHPLPSNAVSPTPRLFRFPPWARVQIVSPETGLEVREGETGLIRVFDLANVYSVMAIQTEDLGARYGDGFALVGRVVRAEPRGCSLMAV